MVNILRSSYPEYPSEVFNSQVFNSQVFNSQVFNCMT